MDWLNKGPGRMSFTRQQREEAIRICRDVYGGTLRMRQEKDEYLPPFPKEPPDVYEARVKKAVLFNVLKRTVKGLSGMVHRKPPTFDDEVPDDIALHLEDIDRGGRSLKAFSNDGLSEAFLDGLAVIVTDMPRIDEGRTRDEVGDARPYWYLIKGEDVLAIEHERRAGGEVFTELRWRDQMVVRGTDKDPWEEKAVPVVRQFLLVTDVEEGTERAVTRVQWTTWTLRETEKGKRSWVEEDKGLMGQQMDEIPMSVTYTNRLGTGDAEPALLDLATENVRHFQKLSDKDNYEHVSSVSIFTLIGVDSDEVKSMAIGPTVGIVLPKDGDAKYVETTGEGATVNRESLKDSEHRMALLGLSMLHSESRAAETATSKRIDKSESDSQLSSSADSHEQALNNALRLHAKWLGRAMGGRLAVNRDFEAQRMDAQMVAALAALVPDKLSLDTFWDMLEAGEVLPDTFDPDIERERLETQDMETLAAVKRLMEQQAANPDDDDDEGAAA